ncbi:hypothetical protein RSAG8_08763, partial [Rhizoctonia solani AG-8 WAC10335]
MSFSLSTRSSDSPPFPRLYIYLIRTALTTSTRSPSHLLPCLCLPSLPGVLAYAATPLPSLTLRLRPLGEPTQQSLGRLRQAIECDCIDTGRDFVQYYRHQPGNRAYVARSRKSTHDQRRKGNFGGWAQVTSFKDGPLLTKRDALDVMDKCDAGSFSHRSTDSNRITIAISHSTLRNFANIRSVFLELALAWIGTNYLQHRSSRSVCSPTGPTYPLVKRRPDFGCPTATEACPD